MVRCWSPRSFSAFILMIFLASAQMAANGAATIPPAANIHGFGSLFGVAVYAFMCHHSLPSLITPMRWLTSRFRPFQEYYNVRSSRRTGWLTGTAGLSIWWKGVYGEVHLFLIYSFCTWTGTQLQLRYKIRQIQYKKHSSSRLSKCLMVYTTTQYLKNHSKVQFPGDTCQLDFKLP